VSGEACPVLWIGRVAVVTLPVEIDVTNADAIREDLLFVLNQGAVLLVADMSKTTFCDSAGVSALVRTFRRAVASSSGLRLVVCRPAVHRVLSLTGVDRLVDVFPSVAACLAGPYEEVSRGGQPGQPESASAKADSDGGGTAADASTLARGAPAPQTGGRQDLAGG
jgi:anti-sigma B factor antagonist